MKAKKKVGNSASYRRTQRLKALTVLALERYSMEEILLTLYEEGDTYEFKKAAMFATDELIDKDGSGDIVTINMKNKGMNCLDKLKNFLAAEIFPFVNEQQDCLLFY